MITFDGLRVLMMAEDDSRRCFGLFGPPSQPTNLKIRHRACFFIARLTVMLLDVEISPKSKKKWKIGFSNKIEFFKIVKPCVLGADFRDGYGSWFKNGFWQNSKKTKNKIYIYIYIYYFVKYIPKYDLIGISFWLHPRVRLFIKFFIFHI